MKTKDLMIGDWVKTAPHGKEARVAEIFAQGILTESGWTHLYDEIFPIQLTPEILEKNGFKGKTYAFFVIDENKSLEYYYHENRLILRYEGIDEWDNHAPISEVLFRCQCFYVHELQHALRLCGIDKEIEL